MTTGQINQGIGGYAFHGFNFKWIINPLFLMLTSQSEVAPQAVCIDESLEFKSVYPLVFGFTLLLKVPNVTKRK